MEQDFKGSKIIYTNSKGSHSFVLVSLKRISHMWSSTRNFITFSFKSVQMLKTYKIGFNPTTMVLKKMALTFLCIIIFDSKQFYEQESFLHTLTMIGLVKTHIHSYNLGLFEKKKEGDNHKQTNKGAAFIV